MRLSNEFPGGPIQAGTVRVKGDPDGPKDSAGCAISGICCTDGERISGLDIIKSIAGDHGFKEHLAIGRLNQGETFRLNDVVFSPLSGQLEQLDSEEYAGVCSYVDWWETEGRLKFEIVGSEFTTWPDADALAEKTGLPAACFRYAGTVDLMVRRKEDGKMGIIDIKRSKQVWPSHELQVNAYRMSEGAEWQAILQINFKLPKTRRWKFTEIDDKFSLFRATMAIWQEECANQKPLERDFPLELKLS